MATEGVSRTEPLVNNLFRYNEAAAEKAGDESVLPAPMTISQAVVIGPTNVQGPQGGRYYLFVNLGS